MAIEGRILLIGAAGYIGSALYRHLVGAGYEVDGIDVLRRGNPGGIPLIESAPDYGVYACVVWMAGCSSVGAAVADPPSAVRENVVELASLANALPAPVKLIYASSGSLYNGLRMADEKERPAIPANAYDATKLAADCIIPLVHGNSFALRFGTVCGASPNMRWDLMLNAMVHDLLTEGFAQIRGESVDRPVLAMADLCKAVAAIVSGRGRPGVYNLATLSMDSSGYARRAAALFLDRAIMIVNGPASPYSFSMSVAKARDDLDWRVPPPRTIEAASAFNSLVSEIAAVVSGNASPAADKPIVSA